MGRRDDSRKHFFFFFSCLFTDCAGPLLLPKLSGSCREQGPLSRCGTRASLLQTVGSSI